MRGTVRYRFILADVQDIKFPFVCATANQMLVVCNAYALPAGAPLGLELVARSQATMLPPCSMTGT